MRVVLCMLVALLCTSYASDDAVEDMVEEVANFMRESGMMESAVQQMIATYRSVPETVKETGYKYVDQNGLESVRQLRKKRNKSEALPSEEADTFDRNTRSEDDDADPLEPLAQVMEEEAVIFDPSLPFTTTPAQNLDAGGATAYPGATDREGDFMRFPFESIYDLASGADRILNIHSCNSDSGEIDTTADANNLYQKLYDMEVVMVADNAVQAACDACPLHPFPINTIGCIPQCATSAGVVSAVRDFRDADSCLLYKKLQLAEATLKISAETLNHAFELQRFEIERLLINGIDLAILRMPYEFGGGRLDMVAKITIDVYNKFKAGELREKSVLENVQKQHLGRANAYYADGMFDLAFWSYKAAYLALMS